MHRFVTTIVIDASPACRCSLALPSLTYAALLANAHSRRRLAFVLPRLALPHSLTDTFTCSFVHSFVHSFIYIFIYLFLDCGLGGDFVGLSAVLQPGTASDLPIHHVDACMHALINVFIN
eukprot:GHVU01109911.1.p1 GENE.GHVU01109911.1~~GHVU01109911.1.p1  ORF type:complete len:120 (+),score=1.33 GHVU01109911.1:404-763(+)